jgi:dsDNA-binding SOS-regulon protein
MAYLKDYKFDIFLSYCHLDNLKVFEEKKGWIENFFNDLTVTLWQSVGTRDVTIWWDEKRLDGNTLFDDSIDDSLKKSAILVCLNSPAYLKSEYCKKELELFYNYKRESEGTKIRNQSRVFNVLLYNIPHQKWPHEFAGATGFPFHDAVEEDDRGHPFAISAAQFRDKMQSLCDSLVELLIEPPPSPEENEQAALFDVYFGDVSDSLSSIRKRTIAELKKKEIAVIPNAPPPWEKSKHEAAVKEKLDKAELSVHLLDQYPGRTIEGEETLGYPQKQAELSLLTSKTKLIWVPADLNIDTIEEEKYKTFLRDIENGNLPATGIKYVRSPKGELTQQVIDMANEEQHVWTGVKNGKDSGLIDTHFNDQLYALDLSKILLENNKLPIINPQEGNPKKNISILEERVRQATSIVLFYGKVTWDWINERVNATEQLLVSYNYPINELFVLLLPPHKDPGSLKFEQTAIKITVMNNSDKAELDRDVLGPFLKSLKIVQ